MNRRYHSPSDTAGPGSGAPERPGNKPPKDPGNKPPERPGIVWSVFGRIWAIWAILGEGAQLFGWINLPL